VDAPALEQAGWGPAAPLVFGPPPSGNPLDSDHRPPWEKRGLALVPFRAALLLTTQRQVELWQASGASEAPAAGLEAAVAEAVLHGTDRTNQFRSLADWLCRNRAALDPSDTEWTTSIFPGSLASDWTEWEAYPAVTAQTFVVVRTDFLSGLGLVVAAMLC